MKPVRHGHSSPDPCRERLDAIIDMRHGLVRLVGLMPRSDFDEGFGKFFKSSGKADAVDGRSPLSEARRQPLG